MKIEARNNQIVLTDVFSGVCIETSEGKQLHICLRDNGFDVSLDDGKFCHISEQSDLKHSKAKQHSKQRTSASKNAKLCCPACGSTNVHDASARQSNGVFGPGHSSHVTFNTQMCYECGNYFRELENA